MVHQAGGALPPLLLPHRRLLPAARQGASAQLPPPPRTWFPFPLPTSSQGAEARTEGCRR